ncbi:putative ABC transporter ATP-binding protein [Oxobacter pfennigii]|uniref:Putative ABC transporter ATP-binding protein n=1 Tax=Oxobacter pfennigii TaxID=36849 RepID=A0A0P8W6J7_9CLOT|nr:ATP-binding cassette domain-containing protein [Oxobacter pfennigii]KPU43642.1 putative ABC transporter ATP-binding protein [Oxobacter pfennigii]
MIVLSCNNICKAYGTNTILENISFSMQEGDKIGLVGVNGAGKSTLFKIIIGEIIADSGDKYTAKDISLGYLPQNMSLDSSRTVIEEVLTVYDDLVKMEARLRELEIMIADEKNMADTEYHERLMTEYSNLQDEFTRRDGYGYGSFSKGVLIGLGFTAEDFDKGINILSGGQKTRVALGKLLLTKPDILLLDEPTNHLDLDAVEWLEDFLKAYRGCLFIISHDRFFLDIVTNKTYELGNNRLDEYNGNYSYYVREREVRKENLYKQYNLQQKEIARQEAIIERFRSYNREKSIKQAESREKALEKIERIDRPDNDPEAAKMSFEVRIKSGNDVLDAENLSKSFGTRTLFNNLDLYLKKGERVALIGPNGTGKTTLFKMIMGALNPDSGHINLGRNVKIGYYDQEQSDLDVNKTVIDEVWDTYPDLTQTKLRTILGAFLFPGEDAFKSISTLSGGEKSRVALVKLMLSQANFLLLDEPTNHLDIISKEALENALLNYDGTILTISHDRYFLNKVVNRIVYLEGLAGTTEYPGNYSYYLEKKGRPTRFIEQPQILPGMTKTAMKEEKRKLKEQAQREKKEKEIIKSIEEDISSCEARIAELHEFLCLDTIYSDPVKCQEINDELKNLESKLSSLYEQWETLV